MPEQSDEKLQACISFIIEQIKRRDLHLSDKGAPPFFLGVNGVQGIGKTSLVCHLDKQTDVQFIASNGTSWIYVHE